MKEVWKPIKNFENLYKISNLGNVKSLFRYKKILKGEKDKDGYGYVKLYKNKKAYNKLIHRLVAEAFIPNPDNLPQVNHIDECKANNVWTNLEWCSNKYNINYGTGILRSCTKRSKKVNQYDLQGLLIKTYNSLSEASRETTVPIANICRCCKNERRQAGSFVWKYIEKKDE